MIIFTDQKPDLYMISRRGMFWYSFLQNVMIRSMSSWRSSQMVSSEVSTAGHNFLICLRAEASLSARLFSCWEWLGRDFPPRGDITSPEPLESAVPSIFHFRYVPKLQFTKLSILQANFKSGFYGHENKTSWQKKPTTQVQNLSQRPKKKTQPQGGSFIRLRTTNEKNHQF